MLTDEDDDVGDPDFDLDALPGDGPSVDESINVSSASFELFKALEGDIRPLPRDGDYGIHQPRVWDHLLRLLTTMMMVHGCLFPHLINGRKMIRLTQCTCSRTTPRYASSRSR